MNAIIRQKGEHVKLSILHSLKRYLKPNFRTYSSLKYNYNAKRYAMSLASNTSAATTTTVISAIHQQDDSNRMRFFSPHDAAIYRQFHTSLSLNEMSSKVDATVKKLKTKQKEKVEEIMKEVANAASATAAGGTTGAAASQAGTAASATAASNSETISATVTTTPPKTVAKAPLKDRIWEELVHYYHGFRLLFIDVSISSKLLWRVLNGKTLTRRENNQLLRTTSDLFRLIPFSVFVIVPFMELLLPLFIKFFPGMLPSTFQTAKDHENRLRQSLAIRLEMAKFLQRTLDEMPAQHRDHKSEEAKQFEEFFEKIKSPTAIVSNEDIIKFAKRFDDEITLDALSREQLAALCRVLELNTIGTTILLRFQLRLKLRSLMADDRVISREGVDSLDLFELQQACKSRGMRAYGLTAERLRFQLKEWIDLSLNERVPPTLLLLTRAIHISDDSITTDKLKETMRGLPDAVAAQTKHAISEREGKIDHKTKIEIIKEEERKIKEEREEEREETKAKRTELGSAEDVPYISSEQLKVGATLVGVRDALKDESGDCKTAPMAVPESEKSISSSDVRLLSDALKTLSSDKKLVVEKETIKELKEELADYKDDVEELREVRQVVKEPVHESRAAKLLYNRVNKMIGQLDKVLNDLEQKQEKIRQTDAGDIYSTRRTDFVHIDELVSTIKRMKEASDETRFKVVEDLLFKLDDDKDGAITVNEIMKAVKSIDNTHQIDKKQLDEFTTLLSKQAQKRQQEELVHIGDLMRNVKKLKETSDEARLNHIESVLDKFDSDKDGVITINEILKVLESLGRENINLGDKQIEELIALLDKEQILHAEEKIEKAIAKSMKEANKLKAEVEKSDNAMNKLVDNINDSAQEIKDIAKELGAIQKTDELKDIANEMKDKAAEFKKEAPIKDIAKALGDNAKELQDTTKSATNLTPSKPPSPTNPVVGRNPPKKAAASSMSASVSAHTESVIREAAERQMDKLLPHQIAEDSSILPPTAATTTLPPSKTSVNAASAAPAQAVNSNTKKVL